MAKRSREEQQDTQDSDSISILLADGSEPVRADRRLLAALSSVLGGMPASPTWDLSGLLIDGQPVGREALLDWLNVVYMHTHDERFDRSHRHPVTTVADLGNLLALADALGSPRGVVRACCAGQEGLQLELMRDCGGVQALHVPLDGKVYTCDTYAPSSGGVGECALRWWQTYGFDPDGDPVTELLTSSPLGASTSSDEVAAKQRAAEAAVAVQLERLLWLALKLELVPLADKLHAFIAANSISDAHGLFAGDPRTNIFSARVLAAASSTSYRARPAWFEAVAGQAVSFEARDGDGDDSGSSDTLFITPLTCWDQLPEVIKFSARMGRDFLGWRKDDDVQVQLHLFGHREHNEYVPTPRLPYISINGKALPLRLALV